MPPPFIVNLNFLNLWFEIHVNLSKASICFFQLLHIYDLMLFIVFSIFDQDQFNAVDKLMLTILSLQLTLATQPVGAVLIFFHY